MYWVLTTGTFMEFCQQRDKFLLNPRTLPPLPPAACLSRCWLSAGSSCRCPRSHSSGWWRTDTPTRETRGRPVTSRLRGLQWWVITCDADISCSTMLDAYCDSLLGVSDGGACVDVSGPQRPHSGAAPDPGGQDDVLCLRRTGPVLSPTSLSQTPQREAASRNSPHSASSLHGPGQDDIIKTSPRFLSPTSVTRLRMRSCQSLMFSARLSTRLSSLSRLSMRVR